jgi:hypothetical protein
VRQLHICLDTGMYCNLHVREYLIVYRGPGFISVIRFGSSPTPFPPIPSPVGKLDRRHTRKTEKERQLADGRGGREGESAKSNDHKKACSSKYHSILSDSCGQQLPCRAAGIYSKVGCNPTAGLITLSYSEKYRL